MIQSYIQRKKDYITKSQTGSASSSTNNLPIKEVSSSSLLRASVTEPQRLSFSKDNQNELRLEVEVIKLYLSLLGTKA